MPTDLYAARAAIAAQLTGPSAEKQASHATVAKNDTFDYLLVYHAGADAHTVTISDAVPAATTVLGASGNGGPAPSVDGQTVEWTVPVGARETVTLTIGVRAEAVGLVTNTATFSGTGVLTEGVQVLVYGSNVYLPAVRR